MIDEEDVLICLGSREDASEYHGAVLPPIAQASLFRQKSARDLLEGLKHEDEEFMYTRGQNPTVAVLETRLAGLERGESCKCFASGIAAISAVFTGLLKSGDHILFINNIYGPTLQLAEMLTRFGIEYTAIQHDESANLEKHLLPNTRIIYFESPGSMLFRLVSIGEIVRVAKERGILTCIDNSVATPLFQKPIPMGVDLVVHSCTKYIGGHSDVVGGALITNRTLMKEIYFRSFMLLGGIQAPFNAWLLLRGLMSMPARLRQHERDGLEVAKFLSAHKRVKRVFHPAVNKADAALFAAQMKGYTGLFSAEIDVANFEELCAIADRLKLFGKAVSWGGVESLVIPSSGFDDEFNSSDMPKSLIRLSIGLEGAEQLIADLSSALD